MQNLGYSISGTLDIPVWDWLSTRSASSKHKYSATPRASLTAAQRRRLPTSMNHTLKPGQRSCSSTCSIRATDGGRSLRLTKLRYAAGESCYSRSLTPRPTYTSARQRGRRSTSLSEGPCRAPAHSREHNESIVIFLATKRTAFLSLGLCRFLTLFNATGCKKTERSTLRRGQRPGREAGGWPHLRVHSRRRDPIPTGAGSHLTQDHCARANLLCPARFSREGGPASCPTGRP